MQDFPGPEQPISEPGEVAIPIVNQIVSGKSGKCNPQLLQTFRRLVQVRMPWRSPGALVAKERRTHREGGLRDAPLAGGAGAGRELMEHREAVSA